jgi:tight adherence protein C
VDGAADEGRLVTAALLGMAWATVIATAMVRQRAVARRLRLLTPRRSPAPGRALLSPNARLLAGVLAFAGACMLLGVAAGTAAGGAALLATRVWPRVHRRRMERHRLARLEAELPEVVDLLVLAVGAGLNVPLALDAVSRVGVGGLAAELGGVVATARQGHRLADALESLPSRAGEAVRPLVAALVASERYGAPLASGLERLADEVRATRRRRADVAARQVSVKLLFPLVLCILPAFALLTVAPLIASALRSLRL